MIESSKFSSFAISIVQTLQDNNFEAYLEINGMGDGIPNNDSVATTNVISVTSIDIEGLGVSDLTGIEDFTALTYLDIGYNSISGTLSLSTLVNLQYLNYGILK